MKLWNSKTARFPFNNRGEVQPPPPPPPDPNEVPKDKAGWDKLATENPQRWISLTQSRMDQAVREGREAKEKAAALELKTKNYEVELANLKKGTPPAGTPPPGTPPAGSEPPAGTPPGFDPDKPFSRTNVPQTQEQWDQLFIENPSLATDLRVERAQQEKEIRDRQSKNQTEFVKSRRESAKDLWDRHPDMYVPERDAEGKPKLDEKGKPVLKIDPNIGGPILDLDCEKGKLFVDVYLEDQVGYESAKTGPRLAMLEMERRLVERGKQKLADGQPPSGGPGQPPAPDDRGTLPAGVPPPSTTKVTFSSDEEKAYAQKAVERGIYKDLGQYCLLRDGKNTGITESGRTPDFSKK